MSCEICGKANCTKSFHSLEAQDEFDNVADIIKDRAIRIISKDVNNLGGHYHGDNFYVRISEVLKIIEDYN